MILKLKKKVLKLLGKQAMEMKLRLCILIIQLLKKSKLFFKNYTEASIYHSVVTKEGGFLGGDIAKFLAIFCDFPVVPCPIDQNFLSVSIIL